MFDIPVKGTHAHAYVTSFTGKDDLKDATIKHRTDDSIIESEFYDKCIQWRKDVAAHLKLLESDFLTLRLRSRLYILGWVTEAFSIGISLILWRFSEICYHYKAFAIVTIDLQQKF